MLARSSVRYYHEHAGGAGHRVLLLLYRLGSFAMTLTRSLAEGRPNAGFAYGRGLLAGWRDLQRAETDRDRNEDPTPETESMRRTSDARREAI